MAIDGPLQVPGVGPAQPAKPASPMDPMRHDGATGTSFKEILRTSIQEVNQLQVQADAAIRELTLGRTDNVSAVVNQVEKADLAFRALLAVRNKLMDAYEEINRLRI